MTPIQHTLEDKLIFERNAYRTGHGALFAVTVRADSLDYREMTRLTRSTTGCPACDVRIGRRESSPSNPPNQE